MTPPPTSHSTDWSETATTTASSPSSASLNSQLLRRGSSSVAVSLCTCQCYEKRLCCVTLRQSTLLTALVSVIFSLLIFAHEVALEGGFNLRNYVVLAFCIVWLIVTALLTLGAYKRAHFLLLPWMILTCVLLPLFIVGIVAGWKVIATCMHHGSGQACVHEFHMFGTNDHTSASIKLSILLLIFILNGCCFLVVYRYFVFLTSNENRKRAQEQETGVLDEDHPSAAASSATSSVRYERFQDEEDPETHVPLCQGGDDTRETTT